MTRAKQRCAAPGCTNRTRCGICDDCDRWVDEQVAAMEEERRAGTLKEEPAF